MRVSHWRGRPEEIEDKQWKRQDPEIQRPDFARSRNPEEALMLIDLQIFVEKGIINRQGLWSHMWSLNFLLRLLLVV